jgi:hypothetical protein
LMRQRLLPVLCVVALVGLIGSGLYFNLYRWRQNQLVEVVAKTRWVCTDRRHKGNRVVNVLLVPTTVRRKDAAKTEAGTDIREVCDACKRRNEHRARQAEPIPAGARRPGPSGMLR